MNLTPQEKYQSLCRACSKDSFLPFMRYTWQSSSPFLVGKHTQAITDSLTQANLNYSRGISTYLLVKVPFRHGKSEIVSRNFPPWFLGKHPDAEILLATYAQDLSDRMSRDARKIIRSPKYQQGGTREKSSRGIVEVF